MGLDNWCSPAEVADSLEQYRGGPVGLDPCSNERSLIRARRVYVGKVALMLPWGEEEDVYENPPYSRLEDFTRKGVAERYCGHTTELVRLVPVATSTAWWRVAMGLEEVRMFDRKMKRADKPLAVFTKRLKFIGEDGEDEESARFDSVLLLYGATRRAQRRFLREFAPITSWTYGAAA